MAARDFVYRCVGCGLVSLRTRCDVLTCSTACRVRANRNGRADSFHQSAKEFGIKPGDLTEAGAWQLLVPDAAAAYLAGRLSVEALRDAAYKEFIRRVFLVAEARNGSPEALREAEQEFGHA